MPQSKDETKKIIDDAADKVKPEFDKIKEKYPEAIDAVAKFLDGNYLAAGYKRLSRMIMGKEYKEAK